MNIKALIKKYEAVEEFVDFQSCLLMYGIDFELRNEVE